jgi:hypothetical protein
MQCAPAKSMTPNILMRPVGYHTMCARGQYTSTCQSAMKMHRLLTFTLQVASRQEGMAEMQGGWCDTVHGFGLRACTLHVAVDICTMVLKAVTTDLHCAPDHNLCLPTAEHCSWRDLGLPCLVANLPSTSLPSTPQLRKCSATDNGSHLSATEPMSSAGVMMP